MKQEFLDGFLVRLLLETLGMSFLDWSNHFLTSLQVMDSFDRMNSKKSWAGPYTLTVFSYLERVSAGETLLPTGPALVRKLLL